MAAKRKSAALEGLAIEDISSVTADMADELRSRLIEQKRRKTKKRLRTGLSIDIGNNQPPQGALTFFGLPQELWDEVYRYLWEESPLIKQQYLQRYYTVTYGERHDLLPRGLESGFVCCMPWCSYGPHRRRMLQAAWLLTSKHIMVEGFAAFHRRSVWIFESWSKPAKSSYVFPLIIPARVHEQHLYISGTSGGWHGPSALQYPKIVPRLMWQDFAEEEIVTPTVMNMGLVNVVTTSTDSEDAVRKIKLYIVGGRAEVFRFGRRTAEYRHAIQLFDYSKLDRLAVHRKLKALEVEIRVPKHSPFNDVERLKPTVENLVAELENVGKALVPGGTAAEVDTEVSWPAEDGVNCFQFRWDKS